MKRYVQGNVCVLADNGEGYYIEVDDKILKKTLALAVTEEELKNLKILLNKIFKEKK